MFNHEELKGCKKEYIYITSILFLKEKMQDSQHILYRSEIFPKQIY